MSGTIEMQITGNIMKLIKMQITRNIMQLNRAKLVSDL